VALVKGEMYEFQISEVGWGRLTDGFAVER
jgi:hypothetical protein